MRVTLKDIAAKVGVDPSAVSLALNDRTVGKLSVELARKIREVAAQVGYRRNLSATHLAMGKTQCIGVILSYLDHYPYNHYFNLISQACNKLGYHAVPLAIGRRSLFEHSTFNMGRVHVDGMIVLDYRADASQDDLAGRLAGYPLVARITDPGMARPNFPNVLIDYCEGTSKLLRHIVARGWRKFIFVVEEDPSRPHGRNDGRLLAAHEERAIRDTSKALGLPIDYEQNVIRTPARGAKARYDAMLHYLMQQRLEPGVCLVQDGADGVSGTYAALVKMGYSVGQDVAVAAMGAIPPWEHVEPVPTFVWERCEEISRLLVKLSVNGIEQTKKYSKRAQFNYETALHEFGAVPEVT